MFNSFLNNFKFAKKKKMNKFTILIKNTTRKYIKIFLLTSSLIIKNVNTNVNNL